MGVGRSYSAAVRDSCGTAEPVAISGWLWCRGCDAAAGGSCARGPDASGALQVYGFTSAKKMASVLVNRGDGTLRLYNKGASEWVLDVCTHLHEADGSRVPLTEARKTELLLTVTEMASRGLRTLVRPCHLPLKGPLGASLTGAAPVLGPGRQNLAREGGPLLSLCDWVVCPDALQPRHEARGDAWTPCCPAQHSHALG